MKFSNNCEVKLKPLMSSRSENIDSCRHIDLNCRCTTATSKFLPILSMLPLSISKMKVLILILKYLPSRFIKMFLNFIILYNWSRERREDTQNLMEMTNDRESYQ